MTDIIRFYEEGEHKYVETHWDAINSIPYASEIGKGGHIMDGIMTYEDKMKLDKLIILDEGIVLVSPNGSDFLLTVSNDGELGTKPFYIGGN